MLIESEATVYVDLQHLVEDIQADADRALAIEVFLDHANRMNDSIDGTLAPCRQWKLGDRRLQKMVDRLEQLLVSWKAFLKAEWPENITSNS